VLTSLFSHNILLKIFVWKLRPAAHTPFIFVILRYGIIILNVEHWMMEHLLPICFCHIRIFLMLLFCYSWLYQMWIRTVTALWIIYMRCWRMLDCCIIELLSILYIWFYLRLLYIWYWFGVTIFLGNSQSLHKSIPFFMGLLPLLFIFFPRRNISVKLILW
jgi:hypothetical protein